MTNPLIGVVPTQQSSAPSQAQDIGKLYSEFRQNPLAFLAARKLNIPQEYASNPLGAVQYLVNSGQVSQQQFNTAQALLQQNGFGGVRR